MNIQANNTPRTGFPLGCSPLCQSLGTKKMFIVPTIPKLTQRKVGAQILEG